MTAPGARDDEDDFARPFLTAASLPAPSAPPPGSGGAGEARHANSRTDGTPPSGFVKIEPPEGDEFVRPYLVTGGRVHDDLGDFSTIYALTETGRNRLESLAFEARQIAELCAEAQSVAELSALLHLPLGVVTVLTRDLADSGHLAASTAKLDPTTDVTLITRLIHAVHAL